VNLHEDAKHLLDLFELLYYWHDGAAGDRSMKTSVDEMYTAGCSDSLIASYAQLRDQYKRGRHESQTRVFDGYAFGLALLCIIELDPANVEQRKAIGEMLLPNFAHAPAESIGHRWLEDVAATAWRIAVPVSAEEQR
jgi:hypothetical protein